MSIKKVFFDANIFNDIFDQNRAAFADSSKAFTGALKHGMTICTSCDIITNIYYITAKYVSKDKALEAIALLNTSVHILPFGAKELTQTITLMRNDADYNDLEDTIQYILALNHRCDLIVTNDQNFVAKEIACMSTASFVKKYLKRSADS